MKKILTSLFAFALLMIILQSNANAQLTGTKTIPGTYATIAAAITDLNAQGVGSGGVTFNITPGHTETVPSGGLVINITSNQPTSGNPVVFQRNGAGANPIIQSDAGGSGVVSTASIGSNGDALVKLVGTDYVTFNNISFVEQYTGGTQSLKTEYLVMYVRASGTDGCKGNSVTNCTFEQQKSDIYSACIVSLNIDASGVTTNPTDISGRHESLSVQGCTMNNSSYGMYFLGYSAPSPYDLFDHFYNIGTTTGNTLTNMGSAGVTNTNGVYGIFGQYHDSIKVNNNTVRVNNGTNNSLLYGIFLTTSLNSSADVVNNTVSDTSGATTGIMGGIAIAMGGTGTDNTVNVMNNRVTNCFRSAVTSGASYFIYLASNPYKLNVTGNTVRDNIIGDGSSTSTGSLYGIYFASSTSTFEAKYTIANNNVENITRNQSTPGSGTTYMIYAPSAAYNTEINNNTVDSIFNNSTTGTTAGIYYGYTAAGMVSVHDNSVSNIFKGLTGTSGTMYGIYQSSSTDTSLHYNNTVSNIVNYGTTATVYGYYNFGSMSVGIEEVYNNTYHDIKTKGSGTCIAMNIATGLSSSTITKNVYGNEVYNIVNDSIGQTGGIRVDYVTYGNIYGNMVYNVVNTQNDASLPAAYGMLLGATIIGANYDVYNNMVSEVYAPISNSALGVLGLWINGGDTANVFYNTIYMDSSSTGTNTGNYALYIAGTTDATLKNNIIINNFTPAGTGGNIGIFKASGVIYNPASNNNNVYVPTGALNYFYYDGTTTYATFGAYQTAVAPAETNSFPENSPFMNVATHPYNLDMKTTVATLCEGGAMPIAGITTDIHGTTRNGTTPDVGADEFNGIGPVTQAPTLVAPSNNAVLVELNPLMNWDNTTYALNYHILISTDSTFGSSLYDSDTISASQVQLPNNFLAINTKYYWKVSGKNSLGEGPFSSVWNFTTGVTNIEPTSLPTVFELYQNYPNPFNPTTKIKFDIPKSSFVSLKVYDITGREVATLVNSDLEPQRYEVEWNGAQFASGVYFFRITAGDFVKVQKMILTK
ncbi:MAG: T9SS type A sorting domain-containing protein [Ignavibacteriae bacterium]|nr:T9SS type A sorting domain-containing protein [Ignavibacteriota bacterium]